MTNPSTSSSQILRRALALAAGEPTRALELLRAGMVEARQSDDTRGISMLARHAAVICSHSGDISGAIGYYQEALRYDGDDPYLHFASGSLRRQLSQLAEARAEFARALELARQQGDGDMIALATANLETVGDPEG